MFMTLSSTWHYHLHYIERTYVYFRRPESEVVSDLTQEKMYLQAKVASLEKEMSEIRDSTHQQRIRALDLKHELREVCIFVRNRYFTWVKVPKSSYANPQKYPTLCGVL